MKIICLLSTLIFAGLASAQPLPTQLNIADDTEVSLKDIREVNTACEKKRALLLFENITGEACVPTTEREVRQKFQRVDVYGCKRQAPTTNPNDVEMVFFNSSYSYFEYAYILKNEKLIPLQLNLQSGNSYNAPIAAVPILIIKPGTAATQKYGEFGEVVAEIYYGKDLAISSPLNATPFWTNPDTKKEVESLPSPRALDIQCIQDELGKLK